MNLTLPFWKVESVGNDFPLIHLNDAHELHAAMNAETRARAATLPSAPLEVRPEPVDFDTFLSELAIAICDRHRGVGGDGLLAVAIEEGRLRLRMFNPDGTEDFCGNGIRCAVQHSREIGWITDGVEVRHRQHAIEASVSPDGRITTAIGPADYTPAKVPVLGGPYFNTTVWSGMDSGMPLSLFGSILTTGSTHTIIRTESLPDDETFRAVSAKIEHDAKFPDRTSVIWAQKIAPFHLKIRIWERGVGETFGCGTGASAAAADLLRREGTGGTVTVESKGGSLSVSAPAWDRLLQVEGTARTAFSGRYTFSR